MGRYDDLVSLLEQNNLIDRFKKQSEEKIRSEIKEYPNAPLDYIDFLREVGYGDIGDGYYMIYSGLITPENIFDELTAKQLDGVLFFGDDFNGYCGGFLTTNGWKLIEDDGSCDLYMPEKTFEEFIRDKINTYLNDIDE